MKKVLILVCIATFLSMSCKSSDKVNIYRAQKEQVGNSQISLLNMMRKVPGVVLRGNTPVLRGTANSIAQPIAEPLYVLNDYIIGQSFSSVNQLIDVSIVKKISVLDLANASIYGSRAANGVIIIETF
ncbi:MAG: TonB-dependent receptor plug domain-containing protein [Bacteroidota bacterium]